MPPTLPDYETIVAALEVHRNARPVAPLISIVIPTFNAAEALERTLESIAEQARDDLEVIIADGASRDATVDVIQRRTDLVTTWISAPDSGISDAFNRGIALSSGAFVQIINADDCLGHDQLRHAVDALRSHPAAGFVYGDVVMHDALGRTTRRVRGKAHVHAAPFDSMAQVPHPSLCARRSTYETVGLFNTSLGLTMDYDWLARCFRAGITGHYVPTICAQMAEGGASNRAAITRDLENYRITRHYGTMPAVPAFGRMLLRLGMNATRLGLDALGCTESSFAFRRAVDLGLRRNRP